jgi:hypothetical protein
VLVLITIWGCINILINYYGMVCVGNDPGKTEGETFVYPTGGVGLFGEVSEFLA